MHVHLPKPVHGWRALVGEVGIIVLGVLIALGAEQIVDASRWRSQAAEFRKAVNQELAYDLAAYRYRMNDEQCVSRRMADLSRWRDQAASGKVKPLLREIGRPSVISFGTSVWNARGETPSHMPLHTRLEYSNIYDELDNVSRAIDQEKDVWRSLAAFNRTLALGPDELMRLDELLYRAKTLDWVLQINLREVLSDGAELGIRPDLGRTARYIPAPDEGYCAPLLEQP